MLCNVVHNMYGKNQSLESPLGQLCRLSGIQHRSTRNLADHTRLWRAFHAVSQRDQKPLTDCSGTNIEAKPPDPHLNPLIQTIAAIEGLNIIEPANACKCIVFHFSDQSHQAITRICSEIAFGSKHLKEWIYPRFPVLKGTLSNPFNLVCVRATNYIMPTNAFSLQCFWVNVALRSMHLGVLGKAVIIAIILKDIFQIFEDPKKHNLRNWMVMVIVNYL